MQNFDNAIYKIISQLSSHSIVTEQILQQGAQWILSAATEVVADSNLTSKSVIDKLSISFHTFFQSLCQHFKSRNLQFDELFVRDQLRKYMYKELKKGITTCAKGLTIDESPHQLVYRAVSCSLGGQHSQDRILTTTNWFIERVLYQSQTHAPAPTWLGSQTQMQQTQRPQTQTHVMLLVLALVVLSGILTILVIKNRKMQKQIDSFVKQIQIEYYTAQNSGAQSLLDAKREAIVQTVEHISNGCDQLSIQTKQSKQNKLFPFDPLHCKSRLSAWQQKILDSAYQAMFINLLVGAIHAYKMSKGLNGPNQKPGQSKNNNNDRNSELWIHHHAHSQNLFQEKSELTRVITRMHMANENLIDYISLMHVEYKRLTKKDPPLSVHELIEIVQKLVTGP